MLAVEAVVYAVVAYLLFPLAILIVAGWRWGWWSRLYRIARAYYNADLLKQQALDEEREALARAREELREHDRQRSANSSMGDSWRSTTDSPTHPHEERDSEE